jgi:hypothetical protein
VSRAKSSTVHIAVTTRDFMSSLTQNVIRIRRPDLTSLGTSDQIAGIDPKGLSELLKHGNVLRGPTADEFIRAAARFTLGEGKPALLQMGRALKPHDSAKWTVATYLPFLWQPEKHMFLKPEVTKDFAAGVGHRFATDYEARLDFSVYESLLDLVSKTVTELAEFKPRDRIDVQRGGKLRSENSTRSASLSHTNDRGSRIGMPRRLSWYQWHASTSQNQG